MPEPHTPAREARRQEIAVEFYNRVEQHGIKAALSELADALIARDAELAEVRGRLEGVGRIEAQLRQAALRRGGLYEEVRYACDKLAALASGPEPAKEPKL